MTLNTELMYVATYLTIDFVRLLCNAMICYSGSKSIAVYFDMFNVG